MVKVKNRDLAIALRKGIDGFTVQVVELPGCISEGKTKEEAMKNIKEAIVGYLEAFPE